jgi:hypothetical protein
MTLKDKLYNIIGMYGTMVAIQGESKFETKAIVYAILSAIDERLPKEKTDKDNIEKTNSSGYSSEFIGGYNQAIREMKESI